MRLVQGIHKRRLKNGSLRPAKNSPIIYSLAVAVEGRHPMGQRQLNRLLKLWVVEARLDPSDYSVESLRRTKALHILKGTGDLQTVRALLGHARIESTANISASKQRLTQSRSVGPSISDAVGAHRFRPIGG